jgi:hypothetical protein
MITDNHPPAVIPPAEAPPADGSGGPASNWQALYPAVVTALVGRVLVAAGPCPNCAGVGSLPATTYSIDGPDRYPCGVCGGLKVRLVEAQGPVFPAIDLDALLGAVSVAVVQPPETCDRCNARAACPTCRRCREHCPCTAGADLRGSR